MRMKPAHTSLLAVLLLVAGCGGDGASDEPSCVASLGVTRRVTFGLVLSSIGKSGSGNTPISGTVVFGSVNSDNSVTPSNTVAPNANVWLEQQSRTVPVQGGSSGSATVENLISAVTADSNGRFTFLRAVGRELRNRRRFFIWEPPGWHSS